MERRGWPVQYGAVPRLFVHEQFKGLARTGGGESDSGLAGMERQVQYGGLPGQAEVKAVLAWPEWKDEDGRAFSSMNSSVWSGSEPFRP